MVRSGDGGYEPMRDWVCLGMKVTVLRRVTGRLIRRPAVELAVCTYWSRALVMIVVDLDAEKS